MAFSRRVLPTRLNLLRLKKMKATSEKIRKILEEKREILLLFLKQSIEEYERVSKEIESVVREAYRRYLLAKAYVGPEELESIALATPKIVEVEFGERLIFNVRIPTIRLDEDSVPRSYFSLAHTHPFFLSAYESLVEALKALLRLSEAEVTVMRLLDEFKKTQRLINALDHIIIPTYESQIKYIEMVLEESMREEFTRLKMLKRILERRRRGRVRGPIPTRV